MINKIMLQMIDIQSVTERISELKMGMNTVN